MKTTEKYSEAFTGNDSKIWVSLGTKLPFQHDTLLANDFVAKS